MDEEHKHEHEHVFEVTNAAVDVSVQPVKAERAEQQLVGCIVYSYNRIVIDRFLVIVWPKKCSYVTAGPGAEKFFRFFHGKHKTREYDFYH